MASKPKPQRTDVVIIGAGASGAAAAKVLCEAGVKVVALEKGPWRRKETFGGDELANINRYNLWPDPILNPRTWRESAADPARSEMFCPVPQMVGGGTVHWQGWLPRFTANDFRMRTVAGPLPGTSLADWPIGYDELEPYYLKVEWAFGVSGQAGANAFESHRSGGYPCPPMPKSRYAQKFMQGCDALGWNAFPTPQAALSRPFNGRKATVVSAFAQQHGDPTGTRSSAPQRLRAGCGRDRPLRPAARQHRPRTGPRPPGQDQGRGLPGHRRRQRRAGGGRLHPGLRRRGDGAASAALAIRPLPDGPRQRQRPRRPQRHLPRIFGRGRHLRRPRLCLGGRRLCERLDLPALRTRCEPRLRVRRPHGGRRRRHPAADQLAAAGHAGLGGRGQADRPRAVQPLARHRHGAARHAPARQPHRSRRQRGRRLGPAGRARDAEAAQERPRPGPLPDRPRRRHSRSQRRPHDHKSLRRPRHRQLLAPARHGPHGPRPRTPPC